MCAIFVGRRPMNDLWTLETLKRDYGDLEVSVGRIPYGQCLVISEVHLYGLVEYFDIPLDDE